MQANHGLLQEKNKDGHYGKERRTIKWTNKRGSDEKGGVGEKKAKRALAGQKQQGWARKMKALAAILEKESGGAGGGKGNRKVIDPKAK